LAAFATLGVLGAAATSAMLLVMSKLISNICVFLSATKFCRELSS